MLFFCFSWMLSFRSADLISLPEFGSLISLILLFIRLPPVEKTLPVIENLWPILLVDDFSPVFMLLLLQGSWPRLKLCLYWKTFSVLFLPRPKLPNHDSFRGSWLGI